MPAAPAGRNSAFRRHDPIRARWRRITRTHLQTTVSLTGPSRRTLRSSTVYHRRRSVLADALASPWRKIVGVLSRNNHEASLESNWNNRRRRFINRYEAWVHPEVVVAISDSNESGQTGVLI
jgi:hypothetical protein